MHRFIAIGIMLTGLLHPMVAAQDERPCELGLVDWQRGLAAAQSASETSGKPILVLFQEIPGCSTCQNFGRQPLSHPLLVEAIEDLFVPVLVYNNRPEDAGLLADLGEPSWNNPVVRFFDHRGDDLIERVDGIWTTAPLAQRMIDSLTAAGRDVPQYLQLIAAESSPSPALATFAMHCYWEGEANLGAIDGVLNTVAGFVGDREVVQVTYDPQQLDYSDLLQRAMKMECASTVYAHNDEQLAIAREASIADIVPVDSGLTVRSAKDSEQKYYLRNSTLRALPLTSLQAVRVNAALKPGSDPNAAISFLSPRQIQLLAKIREAAVNDRNALDGWVFPDNADQLTAYDQRVRQHFNQ